MKEITFAELLEKFDVTLHNELENLKNRDGVSHIVVFENCDMWSSQLGQRTAVIVGPNCTYRSLEEVEEKWLNDLPSQRQYPNCYVVLNKE